MTMFQKMINYFQPWALGISRQTLEGKVSGRMAKDERNYNWALITPSNKNQACNLHDVTPFVFCLRPESHP